MNSVFQEYVRKYFHPKANKTKKQEKNIKKIAEIDKIPNAILVFQDEVHYTAQTSITAMWALKGSKPKIKSYPGRQKISYSGFVIPSTGQLFTYKPEKFTFETTIDALRAFLKNCPPPENHQYYMVMDNASWHKKAKRLIKENAEQKYADMID